MCQACTNASDQLVATAQSALHAWDLSPSQRHRYEAIDAMNTARFHIKHMISADPLTPLETWTNAIDTLTKTILEI